MTKKKLIQKALSEVGYIDLWTLWKNWWRKSVLWTARDDVKFLVNSGDYVLSGSILSKKWQRIPNACSGVWTKSLMEEEDWEEKFNNMKLRLEHVMQENNSLLKINEDLLRNQTSEANTPKNNATEDALREEIKFVREELDGYKRENAELRDQLWNTVAERDLLDKQISSASHTTIWQETEAVQQLKETVADKNRRLEIVRKERDNLKQQLEWTVTLEIHKQALEDIKKSNAETQCVQRELEEAIQINTELRQQLINC